MTPQRKVIACAVVQRIQLAYRVVLSDGGAPKDDLLRFGEEEGAVFCSYASPPSSSTYPDPVLADLKPSQPFSASIESGVPPHTAAQDSPRHSSTPSPVAISTAVPSSAHDEQRTLHLVNLRAQACRWRGAGRARIDLESSLIEGGLH